MELVKKPAKKISHIVVLCPAWSLRIDLLKKLDLCDKFLQEKIKSNKTLKIFFLRTKFRAERTLANTILEYWSLKPCSMQKEGKLINRSGVDDKNVHKNIFMSHRKYEPKLRSLVYTEIYKFGENAKL